METPTAPVGDGRVRAGEVAGQRADLLGCDAGRACDALGRKRSDGHPDLLQTIGELREPAGPLEPLLEDGAHQRREQERIGARAG